MKTAPFLAVARGSWFVRAVLKAFLAHQTVVIMQAECVHIPDGLATCEPLQVLGVSSQQLVVRG